jgi:hypothetical protein
MFMVTEGVQELSVGETYIVNWNGTEYTCVGQDMSAMMPGAVLLGDGSNFGLQSAGEPFMIGGALEDGIYALMAMPLDGTTELTISITHNAEVVHKLDNRFLDLDWLPTMEWKKGEVLVPEQTPNGMGLVNTDINYEALNPGITHLLVTIDGKEYLCPATVEESTGVTNGYNIIVRCDTPYGMFLMSHFPNNKVENMTVIQLPDGYRPTVSVYIAEQVANKLPEAFLPESVATKEYIDEMLGVIENGTY